MKKALQIAYLRARPSLPKRAVVDVARETCGDRLCDDFAQLGITDPPRERLRFRELLRRRLARPPRRLLARRRRPFRQRPRCEGKPCGRGLPETASDLLGAGHQLEGPDRVLRMHVERAVTRKACRPGVPRDLLAHRGRPCLDERLQAASHRAEARKLAYNRSADFLHHAARTRPGETSSTWVGSSGSDEASVAVISVWPWSRTPSARTRRRFGSSSESTSSRSKSGR